jgi:hypothetical protein
MEPTPQQAPNPDSPNGMCCHSDESAGLSLGNIARVRPVGSHKPVPELKPRLFTFAQRLGNMRVPGHPLRFRPGTWFTSPLR